MKKLLEFLDATVTIQTSGAFLLVMIASILNIATIAVAGSASGLLLFLTIILFFYEVYRK